MSLLDMVPTRNSVARWDEFSPFIDLQRDFSRLADDMSRTFRWPALETWPTSQEFTPKVDVKDNKEDIVITAELPGMSEKDVDVILSDNSLTIKGEKKSEKEEKKKDYYRMERTYGSFERSIMLPCEVENAKAEATFKHGVLTVHVPKSAHAKITSKKIPIKSS